MPGSPIVQVTGPDYEGEITKEIGELFETDKKGVILKADSIGSIEAISRLLKSAGFGVSKKGIGDVTKRDVLDAFTLNATEPLNAVILAFNVKIDEEAKDAIQSSGISVINDNIIYKLLDDYKLLVEEKKKNIVGKVESSTIFPAQIKILPDSCFRVSNPAVFGIEVMLGKIKPGYVLMNENGEVIGKIKEIQKEKGALQMAKKGDDVAISVDGPTFGRQIKDGQTLYTRITDADEKLLLGNFSDLIDNDEKLLLKRIIGMKKLSKRSA